MSLCRCSLRQNACGAMHGGLSNKGSILGQFRLAPRGSPSFVTFAQNSVSIRNIGRDLDFAFDKVRSAGHQHWPLVPIPTSCRRAQSCPMGLARKAATFPLPPASIDGLQLFRVAYAVPGLGSHESHPLIGDGSWVASEGVRGGDGAADGVRGREPRGQGHPRRLLRQPHGLWTGGGKRMSCLPPSCGLVTSCFI
jgi:hypothetical protein